MVNNWLVTVDVFSVSVQGVETLKKWDWSCVIDGVEQRYQVTSGVFKMPENGQDRALTEIMYHARNIAGDAPIAWKARGAKPAIISKRTKEAQAKTRRMF